MLHDDSDEEENNGSWCYCQEAKGGDMIGCENVSCSIYITWFRLRVKMLKESGFAPAVMQCKIPPKTT